MILSHTNRISLNNYWISHNMSKSLSTVLQNMGIIILLKKGRTSEWKWNAEPPTRELAIKVLQELDSINPPRKKQQSKRTTQMNYNTINSGFNTDEALSLDSLIAIVLCLNQPGKLGVARYEYNGTSNNEFSKEHACFYDFRANQYFSFEVGISFADLIKRIALLAYSDGRYEGVEYLKNKFIGYAVSVNHNHVQACEGSRKPGEY